MDEGDQMDAYLQVLKQAQEQRLLTIFVGAGVSMYGSTEYPSWKQIIDALNEDLNSHGYDFQKTAQLYELEFGRYAMSQRILTFFPEVDTPRDVHELIFKLSPQNIVTTNWDSLLEKQNEKETVMYDVIACDRDLVMSQRSRKLIKMHGDFEHHNIVFTENDYLNYSNNFPLIENFLKSIFSTQIVLLLGYSFNDIDLKQIITWIDNKSEVRPPVYMAVAEKDISSSQIRYLETYGIILLKFSSRKDIYEDFLKKKFGVGAFPSNLTEFIRFLRPFSELNIINRYMILRALKECTITYVDGKPVLSIFNKIASNHPNPEARTKLCKIYEEFEVSVTEKTNGELAKLLKEIFDKAQIWGIRLDFGERIIETASDGKEEDVLYNFNIGESQEVCETCLSSLLNAAYVDFSLGRYREASEKISLAIRKCNNDKSFLWLLIAKFNWNILSRMIFRGKPLNEAVTGNRKNNNIPTETLYDLQEDYLRIPDAIKPYAKLLLDFLDFTAIYRDAYTSFDDLRTFEKSTYINAEFWNPNVKHKHFLDFSLGNFIFFDHYAEFKAIHRNYIEIAIKVQMRQDHVFLERFQLFACIRYLNKREIQDIFSQFFLKKQEGRCFEIKEKDQDWLTSIVLPNIQKGLHCRPQSGITSDYEVYFANTFLLLSIAKLGRIETLKVVSFIKGVIENECVTFVIFEAVDLFFKGQLQQNRSVFKGENIIGIIELLLRKLVLGKSNVMEERSLKSNAFYLWDAIFTSEKRFEDRNLIDQVLRWIDLGKESCWSRAYFVIRVVLPIYQFAISSVKTAIKRFCKKLDKVLRKDQMEGEKQERFLVWSFWMLYLKILPQKDINYLEETFDNVLMRYETENKAPPALDELWYLFRKIRTDNPLFFENFETRFKRIIERVSDS